MNPETDAGASALKSFFTEWQTYRLFKDANFLHHREVSEILGRELSARREPFSFLDLASGDASASSEFLRGTAVSSYTAVDFSSPALELARKNTALLDCEKHFLEQDLADFAVGGRGAFDVLFLGLSLHHQSTGRKREILAGLRRLAAPGGLLYLYEPILAPGESREALMPRWKRYLDQFPAKFPDGARDTIWNHVNTCDFPETVEEFFSAGRDAGFGSARGLFTDRHGLYSLIEFAA